MKAALDHVFICCAAGAPEAAALARLGLKEGSSNTHPGQGTASRRFFFQNAYIELLWVSDPEEAQSEAVRRTRLWERWSSREEGACPFGIVLRPTAEAGDLDRPFATWAYHPPYLLPQLAIEIALDTLLSEPAFFYLAFQRGRARVGQGPVAHAIPATEITSLGIGMPSAAPWSPAAQSTQALGLVTFHAAERHLMELTLDRAVSAGAADLRPHLPLVLRW